ncbi:MAG TPA: hypothetical protein DIC64_02700 [Alphaproteobacteria bacterium]|nr:hypothetical protein [Alphaproteobacteria bacterium]
MKKVLLFLAAFVTLYSVQACEKEDPVSPQFVREEEKPQNPVQPEPYSTITQLWEISMRREIPYPFKVYLMEVDGGKWYYLRRLNFYGGELHLGDEIRATVYYEIPDEIASIDKLKCHDGEPAKVNAMRPGVGTYLVASDPIEADVKNMFTLDMRYSLTFTPIKTVVIETVQGNMIYVKASKLAETDSSDLTIGDHFAYNVYTIFPNEVLAIKKMR